MSLYGVFGQNVSFPSLWLQGLSKMVSFLSLRILIAFKKGSICPAWPHILEDSEVVIAP